jgi:hypothetical protein
VREREGQSKYSDVIEMVANLADYLTHPGVAVVAILAEQLKEVAHLY